MGINEHRSNGARFVPCEKTGAKMSFVFETRVLMEWIDYNGHMRDSYYGLVFSLAVDALQDEVGLDAEYRERTGCTIYLIEDHKVYLKEVHVSSPQCSGH
jgi:acyl-CoA thioester hydrolase